MCDYQRGTVECTGTGLLWDADKDGWSDEFNEGPCPQCNTQAFLERAKDDAESTISGSGMVSSYTGESLWLSAVRVAEACNPAGAVKALAAIGVVACLAPADNDDGYESRRYMYQ